MDKLKMQTPNLIDEKIEQIAKLFPHVMTETKDEDGNSKRAVGFDLLKQSLSDVLVDDEDERYRLDWPGKKASLLNANTPINKTLRPCREESVEFDTTENVYIEGDNIEVLKILQESYLAKIKMIYIDPPYNTGKDFIYKDNFKVSKEEYEEEIGLVNNDGNKLFKENTKTNPRYHSDWLCMMYERLIVARDLLSDDGVLFISIDDNEVHNLRKICDEIFGDGNFLGNIARATGQTTGQDSGGLGSSFDFILAYTKNGDIDLSGLPLTDKDRKRFENRDDHGEYAYDQMRKTGSNDRKEDRPNMFYCVDTPDKTKVWPIAPAGYESCWRFEEKTYKRLLSENYILWKKTKRGNEEIWWPYVKYYLDGRTKRPSPLWNDLDGNKKAGRDLRNLFDGKKVFDFPKPVDMLKRCIQISPNLNKDDYVLDFFAGSSSLAQAVIELNNSADLNIKFIMVQLPEPCDEKSEAYKAGYKTISDIGKERIRRAGKIIKTEFLSKYESELGKLESDNQLKLIDEDSEKKKKKLKEKIEQINKLDIGFRVYKTDSTNMKDVYYHPEKLAQEQLSFLEDNTKEDRTPDDLLTQVILDLGLELSLPIEKKEILGNTVFIVQTNALVACFDSNINFKIVDEIAELKPFKIVFKDASFTDDKDRINVEERFKRLSPETTILVI